VTDWNNALKLGYDPGSEGYDPGSEAYPEWLTSQVGRRDLLVGAPAKHGAERPKRAAIRAPPGLILNQ